MASFEQILESPREEDVQRYLAERPEILVTAFGWPLMYEFGGPDGAGCVSVCVPKFRFGSEYVSDFVVVTCRSMDLIVVLVELEPSTEKPFTKSGRYARRLNDALKQINDWIAWITENPEYLRRSLLKAVSETYGPPNPLWGARSLYAYVFMNIYAKVIIGRRAMLSGDDNKRRASVFKQTHGKIEIIPYDRLLDTERTLNEKGLDSIIEELKSQYRRK